MRKDGELRSTGDHSVNAWRIPFALSAIAAGFALAAFGIGTLAGTPLAEELPAREICSALLSAASLHLAAAYLVELA